MEAKPECLVFLMEFSGVKYYEMNFGFFERVEIYYFGVDLFLQLV